MRHAEPLPYLETFTKAAELGCFTAAARVLGLTQAAVSQRVHVLERALGVPLFQRRGGRVLLTEAGRRLHPYAARLRVLQREAVAAVTGRHEPPAGELVLAASTVPGEHFLPDLLNRFHKRHPHVQVRATVADTQQVLRQVERGKVDLGLVGGKSDSPYLEHHRFASDRLALIVPAGHPWSRRRRVSLRQLTGQPLVLREGGSGSRSCLERALDRVGKSLHDLSVALELGSNEAIKEAVRRGLGLAILSTHAVHAEVQAGLFHTVQVTGLPLTRHLFAVWDRRRALSIPAQQFLDVLRPRRGRKGP
jgi:DNA-binding transcriptional LysR family regulator